MKRRIREDLLRRLMDTRGLKYESLADRAGISIGTISNAINKGCSRKMIQAIGETGLGMANWQDLELMDSDELPGKPFEHAEQAWVLPPSGDQRTLVVFDRELASCKEAKFCGLGLHLLRSPLTLNTLIERVLAKELIAHLCIGNPVSRSVIRRMKDELIPDRRARLDEMRHSTLPQLVSMEKTVGDRTRFSVNLFDIPTPYAMIIFDGVVYMYPYGIHRRGEFSPTFCIPRDVSSSRFFDEQFQELMEKYSRPAEQLIKVLL
jgi:hypothetical protein